MYDTSTVSVPLMEELRCLWAKGLSERNIKPQQKELIVIGLARHFDSPDLCHFKSSKLLIGSSPGDRNARFEGFFGTLYAVTRGLVYFEHSHRDAQPLVSGLLQRVAPHSHAQQTLFEVSTLASRSQYGRASICATHTPTDERTFPFSGPAFFQWECGECWSGKIGFHSVRWADMQTWFDTWLPVT